MAYSLGKKKLGEVSKRSAINVTFPFNSDAVFNSTYSTVDSYRTDLYMYFLTNKGERYMNPNFGSNLRRYLFENQLTSEQTSALKSTLIDEMKYYFPRLTVDVFDLNFFADEHTFQLHIEYHITDTKQNGELTVNYE